MRTMPIGFPGMIKLLATTCLIVQPSISAHAAFVSAVMESTVTVVSVNNINDPSDSALLHIIGSAGSGDFGIFPIFQGSVLKGLNTEQSLNGTPTSATTALKEGDVFNVRTTVSGQTFGPGLAHWNGIVDGGGWGIDISNASTTDTFEVTLGFVLHARAVAFTDRVGEEAQILALVQFGGGPDVPIPAFASAFALASGVPDLNINDDVFPAGEFSLMIPPGTAPGFVTFSLEAFHDGHVSTPVQEPGTLMLILIGFGALWRRQVAPRLRIKLAHVNWDTTV